MRKHLPFLILLALVAVSRVAILLTSQTHVHSDEAIIGLMAKHIMDGSYYPFYMYGQVYNACAAWEAYVASVAFAVFGVGVIPLKSCVVLMSLLTLIAFYRMAWQLYGQKTAWWSALVLALMPSLLKWDFQVRGYSFYFLAIPVLTGLYFSIESGGAKSARKFFIFGLVSGLSVWCLELILTLVAAFWVLLVLRRSLTLKNSLVGLGGVIIGYLPAILYNATHHFESWYFVFVGKTGAPSNIFHFSALAQIFLVEMPKFFGPDTILWYYPETSPVGWVFYGITLVAVMAALAPFLKEPSRIKKVFVPGSVLTEDSKDLLIFVLALACFVPYITASVRVPGYFLGGCFFFAILTGRLLCRCFALSSPLKSGAGILLALAILAGGIAVEIQTARHNQIETLALDQSARAYYMERIPGADIDAVEHHLAMQNISATWATMSFVYPLVFETDERLAVSGAIFGFQTMVYPPTVLQRLPNPYLCEVFVVETDSPFLPIVKARCAKVGGAPPIITDCGTLTLVQAKIPEPPAGKDLTNGHGSKT
jgi:4-amino-4-deoxy-L-arabinose transferase-like glycosyltransferase